MSIDFNKIKEVGLYDYVSNYGYTLDKDELILMLKEFNYAVYTEDKKLEEKAVEIMIQEIKEKEED